jgi:hypothetical protein
MLYGAGEQRHEQVFPEQLTTDKIVEHQHTFVTVLRKDCPEGMGKPT